MQRIALVALAGLLVLGGPTAAWAGVVWEGGGKDEPAGGGADLKSKLSPVQYNRLIKPIEAKLQAVERTMKAYDKEMEKPVDKRNERLLLACKERAAQFHLGAALAAKKSAHRIREDDIKQAIVQEYQKPNEQKAIGIFLELAAKAQEANDFRHAIGYYKRILQIDSDNAQAKQSLTQIAKKLKQNPNLGRGGSTGGGTEYERAKSWERNRDYSGTKGKHYDDGRGNW